MSDTTRHKNYLKANRAYRQRYKKLMKEGADTDKDKILNDLISIKLKNSGRGTIRSRKWMYGASNKAKDARIRRMKAKKEFFTELNASIATK